VIAALERKLRECGLHEKNGERWVGSSSRLQIDSEGPHRKDQRVGKRLYSPSASNAGGRS
jgi:hypothetical protein